MPMPEIEYLTFPPDALEKYDAGLISMTPSVSEATHYFDERGAAPEVMSSWTAGSGQVIAYRAPILDTSAKRAVFFDVMSP